MESLNFLQFLMVLLFKITFFARQKLRDKKRIIEITFEQMQNFSDVLRCSDQVVRMLALQSLLVEADDKFYHGIIF